MRLKNLKKETTVAIKNKNEYFLLMDLLEKAGYEWRSGQRPAEFKLAQALRRSVDIILRPATKEITYYHLSCGKPIRKVVKFEVGDKVKIREDFETRISYRLNSVPSMSRYIGSVMRIEEIDPDGDYKLYACPFLWAKKWLDIAIEEGSDSDKVDWSKVEVDTPILVRDRGDCEWIKRHFAKFEDGNFYAWAYGKTSWSVLNDKCITSWKYAKLADKGE